ncbi:Anthrone oxygenase AgnL2 [Pseudocercospora fuligena]|uniref:Anthrone oxygenase AgnL2 n=1 Tax=Pseudocercospora fuligena TaxID=685502 RepID=A0A8H6RH45_9PEZI|nr:Anthrone oxygenase AgnL2 [Pseudocercospora fuligena]
MSTNKPARFDALLPLVSGSTLAGAMSAISIFSVPVLLEAAISPPQLYRGFVTLFHLGHHICPGTAVLTFVLYSRAAWKRYSTNRSWTLLAIAGVATVSIVPFTLLFMMSTNEALFDLEKESQSATFAGSLESGNELVHRWSRMHLMRSMFPMLGAALGAAAVLSE